MKINCPHGWKSSIKAGNIIYKDQTVNIFDGICECPDLCGITTCEYYDVTRGGTRRFQSALAHSQTLEGLREELSG